MSRKLYLAEEAQLKMAEIATVMREQSILGFGIFGGIVIEGAGDFFGTVGDFFWTCEIVDEGEVTNGRRVDIWIHQSCEMAIDSHSAPRSVRARDCKLCKPSHQSPKIL